MSTATAVLVAAGGGCGGGLPSPAVVDKLRLFAISADQPEVLAGGSIALSAVWADGSPRAGNRPVYFLWRVCLEGPDHDPRTCLIPARGRDVAMGAALDAVTLGPGDISLGTGDAITTWQVLLAMCPDAPPVLDGSLGQYACPSEASVPNEQREGIQSVRRVAVRAAEPLNHNPTFAQLRVGDQDALAPSAALAVDRCPMRTDPPCDGVTVRVVAGAGSVERRDDGRDETLLASFFTTAGTFDRPRAVPSDGSPLGEDGSLSARWSPPTSAGHARLWVVLRDGRGGDVARAFDVQIR